MAVFVQVILHRLLSIQMGGNRANIRIWVAPTLEIHNMLRKDTKGIWSFQTKVLYFEYFWKDFSPQGWEHPHVALTSLLVPLNWHRAFVQDGVNLELAVRRQLQAHSMSGCGMWVCDLAAWNHNEPHMFFEKHAEIPIAHRIHVCYKR